MIIAKITINDNRFFLFESKPSNIKLIEKLFTFEDTSECFYRGKFRKEKIKYVNFVTKMEKNPTAAMIPIGLLDRLTRYLDKNGGKYKITDEREKPEFEFSNEEIRNVLYSNDNDIVLRDYQLDAVKSMLGNINGVIKAGTGSGKSEIMAAWIKLTGMNTLILFKNIKLAHELHGRMIKAGIDCGMIQGNNIDEDHRVIMATVQSIHKLKRNDYRAVIIDEVHNASQERYQKILKWDIFKYRFGFSATPFNEKNKLKSIRVMAWIGDIIVDVPAARLIEEGHLAKPKITFIKIDKVLKSIKRKDEYIEKEVDIFDQQWQNAEKNGIVNNIYRNKIIKTLSNSLKGTVLVLVKYVESHGEKLHQGMEDALFLSGRDNLKERIDAIEKLENDKIKTIIASTIFDEGVSINNISNVIMAGGGQSYEKTLQRIGRGMRLNYDESGNVIKNSVNIYDFYDTTHHTLERHSKERMEYAMKEGYDVRIKKIDI